MKRQLSPDTKRWLELLWTDTGAKAAPGARPSWLRRLLGARGPEEQTPPPDVALSPLLGQIAAARELGAVPYLLPFLFQERKELAAAVAALLGEWLQAASPTDLAWLDQQVRIQSGYRSPLWPLWAHLRREDVTRLLASLKGREPLLGLVSFHRSGYVREEAVRHLATRTDGEEVSFLLIRANDWVAPVRDRARRALEERLRPEYVVPFARNLPLALRLRVSGRADHAPFVAGVAHLLRSEPGQSALLNGLNAVDAQVARACFQVARELTGEALRSAVEAALRVNDPVIRRGATRIVPTAFEGEARREVLTRLRQDRFVTVRREALRLCVQHDPEVVPELLRQSLLDRHAAIRGDARFALQQRDTIDLAAFYRDALARAEGSRIATALLGLAETGAASDAALAIPHLAGLTIAVRRAALRCLARLDPDGHVPVFQAALRDDAPGIVRVAREVLRPRLYRVGSDWLWTVFTSDDRSHVRRAVLSLIASLGKWESPALLLRAAEDADPEIAARARIEIDAWISGYSTSFIPPTATQLDRLEAALDQAAPALDPRAVEQLRWLHDQAARLLPARISPGEGCPEGAGRP